MSLKQYSLLAFVIILAASCSPAVVQIGSVNAISNRNIDPNLEYELIASYSGGSKKELRKTRAKTVEDAVNQTVKKVPGGEMLMNAKLYLVKKKYFAVEGDVWGKKDNRSYRGFSVGTRIICKDKKLLKKFDLKNDIVYGTVTGLIDDKKVYVKIDGEDRTIIMPYDKITKAD